MKDHTLNTPGPWLSDSFRGGEPNFSRILRRTENSETDWLFVIQHNGEATEERQIVDACLIAAAPDLLEALELALEYFAHRQQRYKNRHPVWVQKARAAIAKARGES